MKRRRVTPGYKCNLALTGAWSNTLHIWVLGESDRICDRKNGASAIKPKLASGGGAWITLQVSHFGLCCDILRGSQRNFTWLAKPRDCRLLGRFRLLTRISFAASVLTEEVRPGPPCGRSVSGCFSRQKAACKPLFSASWLL